MSADTLQTGAVRKFVEKSGEFQRRADRKDKNKRKAKMNDAEEKVEANLEFNEHRITVEEVIKQHNTDFERGLTTEEANRRLQEFGQNALTPPEKIPEWRKFMHHQIGFFSLLLWAGALLCLISYFIDPTGIDNLYLGIVLAVVVFFTGVFAYAQERKSDQLMDSFSSLNADKCRVRRDNTTFAIDAVNLVPGDIVIIQQGEKIPADVRMVKMSNFKVNNSSLTGESEAQARITKPEPHQDNPLEAKNIAFLGTLAQEGTCEGVIIKTGDNTVIGSIAILAQQEEENKPPIQLEIEHFVKIVSAVAIFLGVLFLIIGIANGFDLLDSIVFMIGIIVANVPEGLLATVTLSLALTAKQMFNKKVMVKNLQSVETLGSTTVIASDKTGTLTMNRMTVAHLFYDNKIKLAKGLGEGVYDKDSKTFQMLMKIGVLCNDCEFEDTVENNETPLEWKTTQGGNATEAGFIKFFEQTRPIEKTRADNAQRAKVPFSSAYKFMISINHDENNEKEDSLLLMKGAPEIVFKKCSKILLDGEIVDIADHKQAYDNARESLCFGGERVIGCAYRTLPVEKFGKHTGFEFETEGGEFNFPTEELIFVGLVSLIDPPRPAVPGAVLNCQSAGIKVVMVTGDHPDTAEAIAKQVHIIKDKTRRDLANERGCDVSDVDPADPEIKALVITGKELAQFDEEGIQLDNALDYEQLVFARTTPQQKYQIVEGLQKKTKIRRGHPAPGKAVKHIVAVTGDGVNDSPALNLADIGVAMGIEGTSVAKDAADMILLDDNFASIVKGVEEGRRIFDNLKKSIAYTLSSNIPEITPFIAFIVLGIPLPLPTVLILFIDLGTDMIPAISLAYERKEDDIMKRPPRDARTDRLVTTKLISFSYLQIGVIQALAGFYTYFVVMNDYGFPPSILFGRGDQWESASVISNPADDGAMWLYYNNEFVSKVGQCTYPEDVACWNPLEALRFAQSAFFVSIVLVQWADLLICKTRMLSIRQQGMTNVVLNFGLLSETVIAIFLSYFEPINVVGTRPIRFTHWLAPLPFTMVIFLYDETRKYLMRSLGKQSWIYQNTYY